jgi:hypothetical protein
VGGIYGIATQGGSKRRFQPERSGWISKNLVNTLQINCTRTVAHSETLTPLDWQIH